MSEWISTPTIATMRALLDEMEMSWGADQHIEIKPLENALGTFIVRPVAL